MILCSEWVPSEWVQTADNNITIIPKYPHDSSLCLYQLMSCEVKSKQQIYQDVLT